MEPTTKQTSPAIPVAIIFGFALIALAIFFTSNEPKQTVTEETPEVEQGTIVDGTVPPPNSNDYIKGNPNASIVLIEYSDYECPFCKQFHSTMNQIMDEFGSTGQLAWVYRQFPITQLHPNAAIISEAALCVGDIGGNDAFWNFTDRVFDERDFDAPTNGTKLPEYAELAGISKTEYISCVSSRKMEDRVLASAEEGFNIGARGTPYSIIIVGDQQAVVNGAQPYQVVKDIVSSLIDQIEGGANTETTSS
jgi:protein-disulfide isomerase